MKIKCEAKVEEGRCGKGLSAIYADILHNESFPFGSEVCRTKESWIMDEPISKR